MKITRKRIVALLASLCITSGSVLVITANAVTNPKDITKFSAPANISNRYEPLPQDSIRAKSTNSSVYLQLTQNTNRAFVQVWGLVDVDWKNKCANVTLNTANEPVSSVTVTTGTFYLHNNVNEYGYGLCGLKFMSGDYYQPSTLTGEWAPDC